VIEKKEEIKEKFRLFRFTVFKNKLYELMDRIMNVSKNTSTDDKVLLDSIAKLFRNWDDVLETPFNTSDDNISKIVDNKLDDDSVKSIGKLAAVLY